MAAETNDTEESPLLGNGLDFVVEAIQTLRGSPTERALKFAVIHLDAGIELILKERLVREHWTLAFREPASARRDAFDQGDFQSASLPECVDRLEHIVGTSFDEKERRSLLSFRKKRNKLVHFGVVESSEALKASTARALSFIMDFVADHFDRGELTAEEVGRLDAIREGLAEFKRFVADRWKVIQAAIDTVEPVVSTCGMCGERAVIAARVKDYSCRFCGHPCTADEAAEAYLVAETGMDSMSHYKDGGEGLRACPSCGLTTLIDRGLSGDARAHEQYVCFGCGESWVEGTLHHCLSCGELYDPGVDTMTVCDDCLQRRIDADD